MEGSSITVSFSAPVSGRFNCSVCSAPSSSWPGSKQCVSAVGVDMISDKAAVCTFPPVFCGTAGLFEATLDDVSLGPKLEVMWFPLLAVDVGRRPYTSETHGSIIVAVDAEAFRGVHQAPVVSVKTVSGEALLPPTAVEPGATTKLPFKFDDSVLPVGLDIGFITSITLPGGRIVSHTRRITRVGAAPGGSWTSLDFGTSRLTRNGLPFTGHGWYAGYFGMFGLDYYVAELPRLARSGITWILVTYNDLLTTDKILEMLDAANAVGIGVWVSLGTEMTADPTDTDAQDWTIGNITRVKHHPALLG